MKIKEQVIKHTLLVKENGMAKKCFVSFANKQILKDYFYKYCSGIQSILSLEQH